MAIPFAREMGVTEGKANDLLLNFGGSMGCGAVCGAITGALVAMGAMGIPQEKRVELIGQFRDKFGEISCAPLTEGLHKGTPEMKAAYNTFVAFCLDFVCQKAQIK